MPQTGVFLSSVTERRVVHALTKTLAFNEARLRVIAQNVANIQTPGYRARQLNPKSFQRTLHTALETYRRDSTKPLVLESPPEIRTGTEGRLHVTPSLKPVENVLFHDGTNLSIEREMADLAETGLMHEHATALLRTHFDGLRRAIRGRAE